MRYQKGTQDYALEDKEMIKANIVCQGDTEGVWVRQAEDHVVTQNAMLHFYPFPSWGIVLPSTPDSDSEYRETIDITELRGDTAKGVVLELHPEAWEKYVSDNIIDNEGYMLDEQGERLFV
jgi:hypothetical protein